MKLENASHIAFAGGVALVAGDLYSVATKVKRDSATLQSILVFETDSGRQVDLDISGSDEDLRHRYSESISPESDTPPTNVMADEAPVRRRGRPKLGVVGREVTLLPRHWQWLDTQSGGASAALRRLVEQAKKENSVRDAIRQAQDSTHRFMTAIAGDQVGFEEVARSLFAGDRDGFTRHMKAWPADVRSCAMHLSADAFPAPHVSN